MFAVGIFFGVEYFWIAIFLSVSLRRMFGYVDELQVEFQDVFVRKEQLRGYAIFFVATFMVRAFLFSLIGWYHVFIQNVVIRYEVYFLVSTLLEAPNLFFLYANHYQAFKPSSVDTSKEVQHLSYSEYLHFWDEADFKPLVVMVTDLEVSFASEYRRRCTIKLADSEAGPLFSECSSMTVEDLRPQPFAKLTSINPDL